MVGLADQEASRWTDGVIWNKQELCHRVLSSVCIVVGFGMCSHRMLIKLFHPGAKPGIYTLGGCYVYMPIYM